MKYFIASPKHTLSCHEHITWWATNRRGYTPVLGASAGIYSFDEAAELNHYDACLAIPVDAVRALQSGRPYFASNGRVLAFYDQPGPVVLNSAEAWAALRAAALPHDWATKTKPGIYRRHRRSFELPEQLPATEGATA